MSIFERLKQEFEDLILIAPEVLSDKYIPDELLFREQEMTQIAKFLADFMFRKIPTNMFIWGPTGVGKTHAIQILSRDYNEVAIKNGLNTRAVYVNVKDKTPFQTLSSILWNLGVEFPRRGLSFSEALDTLNMYFQHKDESLVIILDEIDKMKRPPYQKEDPVDSIIYSLSRLDELSSKPDFSIVVISNDNTVLKRLSEPTKSKFQPVPIYFREYDALELKEILRDRVERAFIPGSVDESALALLAGLIKKEGRDLRWAFQVLLQAARGKRKGYVITDKDIWIAREQVDKDVLYETLNNLNQHQLIFLWAIALLKSWSIPPMTGYAYNIYKYVCDENDIPPHTMRHITHYLAVKLETLGLITAKESYYRNSRGRALEFDITEDTEHILHITEQLLKGKFDLNINREDEWLQNYLLRIKQ